MCLYKARRYSSTSVLDLNGLLRSLNVRPSPPGAVFTGYYLHNPPGAFFSMPILLSLLWSLLKSGMLSEIFSILDTSVAHKIVVSRAPAFLRRRRPALVRVLERAPASCLASLDTTSCSPSLIS